MLEAYKIMEEDFIGLSADLLARAAKQPDVEPKEGAVGSVPIDHHFNVRGIGTVILGCVADGWIKKHDKMRVEPLGKTAQIRSVQKHDDDFAWAYAGDRVGCALKDIDAEELDRGFVLTTDPNVTNSTVVTGDARLVKYWPSEIKEQMVISVGHWMQFFICTDHEGGQRIGMACSETDSRDGDAACLQTGRYSGDPLSGRGQTPDRRGRSNCPDYFFNCYR